MPSVASSNPTITAAPLWCDLGCCSQTVVVLKLRRSSAFYTLDGPNHKGTQATQRASDQFRTKTPPHKQRPLRLLVSGLIERWSFQGSVSTARKHPLRASQATVTTTNWTYRAAQACTGSKRARTTPTGTTAGRGAKGSLAADRGEHRGCQWQDV